MTARLIEWDDQPFTLLIESPSGSYLVPPIVFNRDGEVVQGADVLEAIVASDTSVMMPVHRGCESGDLAPSTR